MSADEDPCRRPRALRRAARGPGRRARRPEGRRGARAPARLRRLPHRHVHRLGRRPVAATRRACSATRAPASSRRSARASRRVAPGDHVVTLFSPQCGECVNCRSGKTNICLAIREQQNQGYLPDGTDAAVARRRGAAPLHGLLDVRRGDGHAGDLAGEGLARRRRSRPRACSPAACRPASAPRCTARQVEEGSHRRRVRRRHGRPRRGRGLRGCRAPSGSSSSTSPRSASRSPAARRDRHAGSAASDTVDRVLEETGGFGADFTFEATGLVGVMRQAVESARMGWGVVLRDRRRRQGRDARHRPALPDHRPQGHRRVVRRREGPRPGPAARRPLPRGRHRRRRVHLAPASRSTTSTGASTSCTTRTASGA